MTITDANGLPILGAVNPQQAALQQMQEKVAVLMAEKTALQPDDHDWAMLIQYAITEDDAARVHVFKTTGKPADPPVMLNNATMREDIGPICVKCQEPYLSASMSPCPGMPFHEYLASLPDEVREEVIRKLQSGEVGEGLIEVDADGIREVETPEVGTPAREPSSTLPMPT